ncbi:MAG: hypothetical protein PVF97_00680, partial [Desulfobacterales bacterium]
MALSAPVSGSCIQYRPPECHAAGLRFFPTGALVSIQVEKLERWRLDRLGRGRSNRPVPNCIS